MRSGVIGICRMWPPSGRIASFGDVNEDEILDMMVHFPVPDLELDADATEARLMGKLVDGEMFFGADAIKMVPCGDANMDGRVDDADLSLPLAHWGRAGDWAHGEFSGDAVIGDDDLSLLLANWSGRAALVPEPSAVSILVMGGIALVFRWRRK